MIFAKKKVTRQTTTFAPRKPQSHPVWGLLILALSLLYFVAMLDFNPSQWGQVKAGADPSENLAGRVGVELAGWSIHLLGVVACLMPALLFWVAYLLLFKRAHRVRLRLFLSAIVVISALSGIFNLLDARLSGGTPEAVDIAPRIVMGEETPSRSQWFFNGLGGTVGRLLYNDWITHVIGPFGTTLVLLVSLAVGCIFLVTDNVTQTLQQWHDARDQRRKAREEARRKAAALPEVEQPKLTPRTEAPKPQAAAKPKLSAGEAVLEGAAPTPKASPEPEEETLPEAKEEPKPVKGMTRFMLSRKKAPAAPATEKEAEDTPLTLPKAEKKPARGPGGLTIVQAETTERAASHLPEQRGTYSFPRLDLLADPDVPDAGGEQEDYEATAEALIQTLAEFNVKVEASEVQTGPVITRYEVKPLPGVRVEKIASLDKNIALGLKAMAVRILAPVPGKGTVGIEVPNRKPLGVRMKEIVESKAWAESKAEIPVVLGKDVTGRPIVEDLTKMPHMLIAGSTGSGKTVCINAVIASLLYHSGPDDLRFIMVDPKVVEMQNYNKLPHMLIPVVTDPKKVPGALKYLLREMEHRYQIFAKVGVRNIAGFNAKVIKDKKEREASVALDKEMSSAMSPEERAAAATIEVPRDLELDVPDKKLPYIVCVIDELADLMMVAPADIETGIARLAQLARAAGIHLILATQRPSVNVITGVIKANLPTRISFKVASKVDSRTILDTGGAEALIGKGDMLFIPPGTHNLVRAQGAFVSDEEINAIVDYIHERNGPPQFDEAVQAAVEAASDEDGGSGGGSGEGDWDDDLVPQALDVLRSTKRASTSMLQRRLKIGYNRAARIMEILEDEGIVGPENGSSPREILRDLDDL